MKPKELFDFQREDVARIASILSDRKAVLLASEMGAGKTAVAIRAAEDMGCKRVLVLCPASVRSVWEAEVLQWSGRAAHLPVTGDPAPPSDGWNVVATSVAHNGKHLPYRETVWDLVIVDEAHQGGFKSYTGMEWSSSRMGWAFFGRNGICQRSRKVMFLTGTPVPNYPVELWPMFSVLLPTDRYADRDSYVGRYCGGFVETKYGREETGSSNLPELREKLRPVMVRRLKKDVMVLPDKRLQLIELPPTEEIRRVLDLRSGEIVTSKRTIDSIRDRMAEAKACNSLAEFEKAKNALSKAGAVATEQLVTLRRELSIPKVDLVAGYVRLLLETKRKVIVFYHHTDHGKGLQEALKEFGALRIGGDTPSAKRGEIIRRFQTGAERVMIGQLRAAGAGITLTAASEVVIGEMDWCPGVVAQAAARSHRPGQEEEVTIHILCVEGSPDVLVAGSLISKLKTIRQAVDGAPAPKPRKSPEYAGKGLSASGVGLKLGMDDRRIVHSEMVRIVKDSEGGTVRDGVGFSRMFEQEAKRLAWTRVPTSSEYGRMMLILMRHPGQHRLPEELVRRVNGG
jgi:SWI/SNF-related matrix-associated actin-dependent regulator of chromatin subfamily A-like protein 1